MLNSEQFLALLGAAKGSMTEAQVCRAAGIPLTAITQIRRGSIPSLERAALLADTVGLELVLRAKGQNINAQVLELALRMLFRTMKLSPRLFSDRDAAAATEAFDEAFKLNAKMLVDYYTIYEEHFSIDQIQSWDLNYRLALHILSEDRALEDEPSQD